MVAIRPATVPDRPVIRRLIWQELRAPFDLRWDRFLVALDEHTGSVIGCVQVRTYGRVRELSSLVVHPAHRRQGIGSALVREILRREPEELFLLCEPALVKFYKTFGFERIAFWQAPLVLKVKLVLANLFGPLVRQRRFVAMRRAPS